MTYTQAQWLLLFFIYCLLGWVWETCYVSLRKRKWVNRGFLYGPWLPIYGSGAIAILFVTLPVQTNPALVFFLGMITATVLEYVTGVVMEKLFHMRYWDYSSQPLNVNGHICFHVSLAWGLFSLLMVRVIHPPIDRLISDIPADMADAVTLVLAIAFAVDTTSSVRAALDMKSLLAKLEDSKELLQQAETSLHTAMENLLPHHIDLSEKLEKIRENFVKSRETFAQNRETFAQSGETSAQSNESFAQSGQEHSRRFFFLYGLQRHTASALDEINLQLKAADSETETEILTGIRESLLSFQTSLQQAEEKLAARREADYKHAMSILRRNPSAASRRYEKAFAELAQLRAEHRRK